MVNKNRFGFISLFLAFLLFFLGNYSTKVEAKTDLIIEGNVLGYNLYAIKPTSNPGLIYPALVKVTKVIEGKEKSQYVLVLFQNLNKDLAVENFGLDKLSILRLKRQTFCDKRIKNLIYPGLTLDNGKVVETSQTFTLVPNVRKESLPLKKKIPCYFVTDD